MLECRYWPSWKDLQEWPLPVDRGFSLDASNVCAINGLRDLNATLNRARLRP